jgi:hypothetical protein
MIVALLKGPVAKANKNKTTKQLHTTSNIYKQGNSKIQEHKN